MVPIKFRWELYRQQSSSRMVGVINNEMLGRFLSLRALQVWRLQWEESLSIREVLYLVSGLPRWFILEGDSHNTVGLWDGVKAPRRLNLNAKKIKEIRSN
eukprot:TRINITY_DN34131_c5_g1_i1.p1 TRINITY_DN34131_c5_g1~~TRINITY_DN34131_c5_g1_i1.p1  ORF type:complete len:100 (-),score=12.09 TRINITY_DN34131_c5_g1_i1:447-746(-)